MSPVLRGLGDFPEGPDRANERAGADSRASRAHPPLRRRRARSAEGELARIVGVLQRGLLADEALADVRHEVLLEREHVVLGRELHRRVDLIRVGNWHQIYATMQLSAQDHMLT